MPITVPLHAASALRKVEDAAVRAMDGDGFELMRRAGQAAWRVMLDRWPQAQRIVVVCGPGNNGGDGYVLATWAQASGRDVLVLRLQAHAPRTALAIRASKDYLAGGGRVQEWTGGAVAADVVVDALFGIGMSRPFTGEVVGLVDAINHTTAPVLALDVPSGVDADTGAVDDASVRADCTLQFLGQHPGLRTGRALDHVGSLHLALLDVPPAAWQGIAPVAGLLSPDALIEGLPRRRRDSHKGSHGHVLCVGGDQGMGGALMLCVEAALRCGAGLVSAATRAQHVAPLLARTPECMAHGVDGSGVIATGVMQRADVIALGPGLGRGHWGQACFDAVVASGKPLVLDADALFHLAQAPRVLPPGTILTPHPGEAARLLGGATEPDARGDRLAIARAMVERYGCVVVLKGAGTIVDGPAAIPCVVNAGNPGMAVGGMGDVLTGVVAALRAQGMGAFDAAAHGALLHAHAGDRASRDGERGLLPSDVIACLRACANPSSRA